MECMELLGALPPRPVAATAPVLVATAPATRRRPRGPAAVPAALAVTCAVKRAAGKAWGSCGYHGHPKIEGFEGFAIFATWVSGFPYLSPSFMGAHFGDKPHGQI